MTDLITLTERGLWCETGGFHIDPWAPVERAVITHAHGDHARPDSQTYYCAASGAELLRLRLAGGLDRPAAADNAAHAAPAIVPLQFGAPMRFGSVEVSLHPAGHLLGSAQVRVQSLETGATWVVSGDYKIAPDPTCEAFEPQLCDVFITECTLGLPLYRWRDATIIFDEIRDWWRGNAAAGRASMLYCYALGKAQRVLAGMSDDNKALCGPIIVHGAVARLLPPYEAAGVRFPVVQRADDPGLTKDDLRRALVIAPPSAANSPWLRRFGQISTAFASGWMQVRGTRRRRNVDRGFALSDHADWDELRATIAASGARRIGVTHGHTHALARYLREERGLETTVYRTRFSDAGEEEERAAGDE